MTKIKRPKLLISTVGIFLVFILAMPRLLYHRMPCLDNFHNSTVEYKDCNLVLASNLYIFYALMGLIIVLITYSIITRLKLKKEMIIIGIAGMIALFVGYYTYLPTAEVATLESNVYLDKFYEEYGGKSQSLD